MPPEQPVQVETTGGTEFVRTAGGRVFGWGLNEPQTHLLLGEPGKRLTAIELPLPRLAELRASYDSACGRTFEGQVWCWGAGQVPGRSEPAPEVARVAGLDRVVRLTSWFYGHCALEAKGAWKCWGPGHDNARSLEIGSGVAVEEPLAEPIEMAALPGFGRDVLTDVAVLADRSVWGWGSPRTAGRRDHVDPLAEPPALNVIDPAVVVPFVEGIAALYGWRDQICARPAEEQAVECWGGPVTDPADPEQDGHFTALPAGRYRKLTPSRVHTCGLRQDDQIVCSNPMLGVELVDVADIASVNAELLIIDWSGRVYCRDLQQDGNCATGELGPVTELVEVSLPL